MVILKSIMVGYDNWPIFCSTIGLMGAYINATVHTPRSTHLLVSVQCSGIVQHVKDVQLDSPVFVLDCFTAVLATEQQMYR